MKNFLSEIVFSSKEQSRQIAQQLKAGLLRKIAPKIPLHFKMKSQKLFIETDIKSRVIYFQVQLSVIVVLLKVMLNLVERFF
jgi:hypothetical protein